MQLSLDVLATRIAERRGTNSIRKAAVEIGIGHATLARVEQGHVPDLETFAKICSWLGESPAAFLGVETPSQPSTAAVHFRAKKAPSRDTAVALGDLIIRAREALATVSRT